MARSNGKRTRSQWNAFLVSRLNILVLIQTKENNMLCVRVLVGQSISSLVNVLALVCLPLLPFHVPSWSFCFHAILHIKIIIIVEKAAHIQT